jgi:hypothetical protein
LAATLAVPISPVAETPVGETFALARMLAVPISPVAETLVGETFALAKMLAVPISPVAETPVTSTDTLTLPPAAGAAENGSSENELEPNTA